MASSIQNKQDGSTTRTPFNKTNKFESTHDGGGISSVMLLEINALFCQTLRASKLCASKTHRWSHGRLSLRLRRTGGVTGGCLCV